MHPSLGCYNDVTDVGNATAARRLMDPACQPDSGPSTLSRYIDIHGTQLLLPPFWHNSLPGWQLGGFMVSMLAAGPAAASPATTC